MNIFRFIADMLHLSAILILLYRIKNNRNCIGKLYKSACINYPNHLLQLTYSSTEEMEFGVIMHAYVSFRFVVQDSGNVSDRLLCAVLGPVHVLYQSVQHLHEDLLYRLHRLHNLPDAIQEALLFGKS
jgi:hypothetical protein